MTTLSTEIGIKMTATEIGMGGNGNEKAIPAHLYTEYYRKNIHVAKTCCDLPVAMRVPLVGYLLCSPSVACAVTAPLSLARQMRRDKRRLATRLRSVSASAPDIPPTHRITVGERALTMLPFIGSLH